MSWTQPVENLFIYISPDFVSTGNIAGFDLDWTLIRPIRGVFSKNANDLAILPNRKSVLENLVNTGFSIVIFTNQKSSNDTEKLSNIQRITNFINLIKLPVLVLVSTADNIYRKPNIGMFTILNQMTKMTIKSIFYCGDAAGRPQDFSDSDLIFAQNIGAKFYIPQDLFPEIERISPSKSSASDNINTLSLPSTKSLVIMMGMPGSNKTSFYERVLNPMGYYHVNQDILKTKAKVLSVAKNYMINGYNIVIDATNPQQSKRQEYYNLAKTYSYNVTVLYFVQNGTDWNKLRPKPVPDIAYSVYFKNLEEPTAENTPGQIYQICC